MTHFCLADPLYLLFVIPVLIGMTRILSRRVRHGLFFPATNRIREEKSSVRKILRAIGICLASLSILITAFAMARPQISKTVKHVEETIAIEMAVDISGSMKALDMVNPETGETNSVSRLEMVKKVFSRFVKEGPDNLVGLITFGGYAVTRSPLTTDHNTLITILKEVEVPEDSSSAGGSLLKEETLTAIGDALALSCARLKDTSAKNKVVILLSDGVSNCGAVTPEQAVLTAREMNIRVYTIGVGSTGKAPFREKDMFGRWILKYEDVEMDEELLKNIASLTGGKYYNVMDWNELSSAMNEINALEKSPAVVLTREEHKDLSTLFLLPAAVLLITGVMLGIILSGKPI